MLSIMILASENVVNRMIQLRILERRDAYPQKNVGYFLGEHV